MLQGERLYLDGLKEQDLSILEEWYNDVHFLRFYDYHPAVFKNVSQLKKTYFQEDPTFMAFAIRDKETKTLLGLVEIMDISYTNRLCWISIGFGEQSHQGKGYGYEALALLLEYIFHELNMEKVQLNVIGYNQKAIKLYEKAGFSKEGIYRKALMRDGKRQDLLLYGLLYEEWEETQ